MRVERRVGIGLHNRLTVLFFTVARTDLELTDAEAYGLLVAYAVFVGWFLLETLGVTNLAA